MHRLDEVAPPQFAASDGQLSPQSTAISLLTPPPLAGHRAQRRQHWTAGFPRSRRLSRPWPRLRRLGTGLSAFGIGQQAFHTVDCCLAPGPASEGWAPPHRAQRLRHWTVTAGFPRSRLLSRPAADGGGGPLRRRGFDSIAIFAFRVWLCWVLWEDVMVVLHGCPSRHEPARSQRFPIPRDDFPNELAPVCDSVGKSQAGRGLDATFPSSSDSDFVMASHGGRQ